MEGRLLGSRRWQKNEGAREGVRIILKRTTALLVGAAAAVGARSLQGDWWPGHIRAAAAGIEVKGNACCAPDGHGAAAEAVASG